MNIGTSGQLGYCLITRPVSTVALLELYTIWNCLLMMPGINLKDFRTNTADYRIISKEIYFICSPASKLVFWL
jgi:hypothetical protein